MKQIQQGDVVLHFESIPAIEQKETTFNPILQHGETTGHKHMLTFRHDAKRAGTAFQFEVVTNKQTGERYLKLNEPSDLVHEEHKTITVPPGEYRIGIVREADHLSGVTRQVAD